MESHSEDYSRHSPDKLLTGFTKGRMVLWVVVAVAAHVIFVVITSLGSIRDRWIDPEGAAARKAAMEAARKAAQTVAAPAKVAPTAVADTNAAPSVAATNAPAKSNAVPATVKGQEEIPDDRRNTPVVNRITEAAKPQEIPSQPNELGISIDETNLR
jgi:hypothetical protein